MGTEKINKDSGEMYCQFQLQRQVFFQLKKFDKTKYIRILEPIARKLASFGKFSLRIPTLIVTIINQISNYNYIVYDLNYNCILLEFLALVRENLYFKTKYLIVK